MFKKLEKAWKRFIDWMTPAHDEVSLFIITLTIIALVLTDWDRTVFFFKATDTLVLMPLVFLLIGMMVSVMHALKSIPKELPDKRLMLTYVVIVNFFAGVFLAGHLLSLPRSNGILLLFAGINVFTAVFLALVHYAKLTNAERAISNYDTNRRELIFNSIIALIIVLVSEFYYENHWSITLSVCTFYASNIHKHVNLRTKSNELT